MHCLRGSLRRQLLYSRMRSEPSIIHGSARALFVHVPTWGFYARKEKKSALSNVYLLLFLVGESCAGKRAETQGTGVGRGIEKAEVEGDGQERGKAGECVPLHTRFSLSQLPPRLPPHCSSPLSGRSALWTAPEKTGSAARRVGNQSGPMPAFRSFALADFARPPNPADDRSLPAPRSLGGVTSADRSRDRSGVRSCPPSLFRLGVDLDGDTAAGGRGRPSSPPELCLSAAAVLPRGGEAPPCGLLIGPPDPKPAPKPPPA